MLEIRFHGRGGQGTVVASILLAKAFFDAGYYVQTFPLFGVERRGAPVEAYLRLQSKRKLPSKRTKMSRRRAKLMNRL
jgi:pyruvate ferredoxin oxidoreductase gamma subunit